MEYQCFLENFSKNEFVYGTDFNIATQMMEESMSNRARIPAGWWDENNGFTFTLPYTKKASLQRTNVRSNTSNIKDGFIYPYSGNRKDTAIPDKFELNEITNLIILSSAFKAL